MIPSTYLKNIVAFFNNKMPDRENIYSHKTLIFYVLLYTTFPCSCQNMTLSVKEKINITDTCLSAFKDYYIYPDHITELEMIVKNKLREGDYDSISNLENLTCQLRKDFRTILKDKHIWIDILENLPVKDSDVSDSIKTEKLKKSNFGFIELQFLPGDIAYLKLDAFVDYNFGKETASRYMKRLTEGDAIIIDLRENHGGHENMVRFIASYFFADSVQLNSLYFRFSDSLITQWTDPVTAGDRLIHQRLFILTSGNTSSAAESFTYAMKNYKRATIIGETTMGAAHWKETYILPDLGIFLEIPVARPVNPVTKKDWEGTGISPDISISSDKALERAIELARD
ncbi:MAG: S41 family peptidase [Bacteroidales bacterium]|nr:S41 family peptidase [Bacteroidales bacterium]